MLIYLLYCPISGKGYVGQTIMTLGRRWSKHKNSVKRGSQYPIHNAIRKYGSDAFEITILQEVDTIDALNVAEIYHIQRQGTLAPNGYNITKGGLGHLGVKPSAEVREKMRLAKLGKKQGPHSFETRAKITASLKANKDAAGRFKPGHPYLGRREN